MKTEWNWRDYGKYAGTTPNTVNKSKEWSKTAPKLLFQGQRRIIKTIKCL